MQQRYLALWFWKFRFKYRWASFDSALLGKRADRICLDRMCLDRIFVVPSLEIFPA